MLDRWLYMYMYNTARRSNAPVATDVVQFSAGNHDVQYSEHVSHEVDQALG